MSSNIFPTFDTFLGRHEKEQLLGQKGLVVWMSGLSGSGKSTIANATERLLYHENRYTIILDGDKVRSGLNSNLSFDDEGRAENVRRIAEVAKILAQSGDIVFVSAITPKEELRLNARSIIGEKDLIEVFIQASFATCEKRDVKGLYAKAAKGEIPHFTGKQNHFEEPTKADLVINTEEIKIQEAATKLTEFIKAKL